ncbi:S66 peptidase family protein [Brevibacterium oceani]|uniref:S66 peptidase family protein n=1 Tax=Brevibacterium oceani TaxID=358099 RepID=UPI0015E6AC91|nr:LD-carboxypeptidase [Brevibacterium oceani]
MSSPYLDTAPLQPGDTVRLVAPSGPTDEESLLRAIAQLESWGLRVVPGENVRARHPRVTYLAGTDEQRRSDLVDAWCDPDTDAVIALRGGYGAMRLLDGIDFDLMRRHLRRRDGRPKLLTGSSDITALHQAWEHHLGVATLFCPMVGNDPFKSSTVVPAEVASWLFHPWGGRELGFPAGVGSPAGIGGADAGVVAGSEADPAAGAGVDSSAEPSLRWAKRSDESAGQPTISLTQEGAAADLQGTGALETTGQGTGAREAAGQGTGALETTRQGTAVASRPLSRARTLVPGEAKGRLGGGNLSLVAAGIGSPELLGASRWRETNGPTILMLEDVDEELYRLDNLMVQLDRGGWFASADAVVLGSWEDCAPVDDVEALIMDYLGDAGIPIVSEMGFGHDPDAPSVPLGVAVTLEAPADGRPRMWVHPAEDT